VKTRAPRQNSCAAANQRIRPGANIFCSTLNVYIVRTRETRAKYEEHNLMPGIDHGNHKHAYKASNENG
jgi:hypothetical protein